jgi:hypothetical protein
MRSRKSDTFATANFAVAKTLLWFALLLQVTAVQSACLLLLRLGMLLLPLSPLLLLLFLLLLLLFLLLLLLLLHCSNTRLPL